MPHPAAARVPALLFGACALLAAACATPRSLASPEPVTGGLASAPVEPPQKVELGEPVQNTIARSGPIYVSGQPSEAALRKLKAEGVTLVISLRTPEEMADRKEVLFDEAALAKELGLDYLNVPLGGKQYPATPAKVDEVARALAAHTGKALIHCTVAARASHLWAAYLIRHRGVPPEQALEQARQINLQRPMVVDLVGADWSMR